MKNNTQPVTPTQTAEDLGTCGSTATVEAKENTQTGHTPGTWVFDGQSIRVGNTRHMLRADGVGWSQADARLIAAAPELLWFARRILRELPAKRDWLDPDLEKIGRTAIAKAEGKQ